MILLGPIDALLKEVRMDLCKGECFNPIDAFSSLLLASRQRHISITPTPTQLRALDTLEPWLQAMTQKVLPRQQKCYGTRNAMTPHSDGSLVGFKP
nr:hypothetical protein [Tanacetum cinerariifolium]